MEKKITDDELIHELQIRFQQNKKALQELQEKTEELRKVNRKLKESESLKSHFLSNVTNELVNPFASIMGLSQNIKSLKPHEFEKIRPLSELIHAEAFNLDFQLRNIFAAAKLEAGLAQPEITKVDVGSLIKSVITSYQYKARQKELKVEFFFNHNKSDDTPLRFESDAEKLKLILSNLLNNSIKYSNAAEKIEISADINGHDELVIIVKDYGIGIKDKDKKRLFDRFKKGEEAIHSLNEGYGLGLSVTKAYVDILEGGIEVNSKKDKGAEFTIILPKPDQTTYIEGFANDGDEFFFGETDEEF